ncbi:hypothetical protein CHUAL_006022 [Chamberlinius hualienensis]
MGKRQHQKDKMYLTCTEWTKVKEGFRRLPFDHCSLSLQPFEHPLCTEEGHIFDLMSIVPFVKKYSLNPVTGEKLDAKSLIKLKFHKDAEGKYHCPVLYKMFNESSHIVAVKPTGNVFCYEAIEQLNLKPKMLKDLLDDTPYTKADLIVLQDPSNLGKFDLSQFHHLKHRLRVEDEEDVKAQSSSTYRLKSVSAEANDILQELNQMQFKAGSSSQPLMEIAKVASDKINAAHYSTGAVAASFTSTVMEPVTVHQPAMLDVDVVRYKRIKKKAYVRLTTNLGDLNLELHCDVVPKTCENFVGLCAKGFYDGTTFHRSIRNFMLQGGDPTGSGRGGESLWGSPFPDEFRQQLSHEGRGILSMANSGPNTNKSQFFITYRSCKHLNKKHTIFGKLVGGLGTLDVIEKVPVDEKDKPKTEIKIIKAEVFVNPYEEVDQQLKDEREMEAEKVAKEAEAEAATKKAKALAQQQQKASASNKIGKYIDANVNKLSVTTTDDVSGVVPAAKRKKIESSSSSKYGNFDKW